MSAGLSTKDKIVDVFVNDEWKFPAEWYEESPVINDLPILHLADRPDQLIWRNQGKDLFYSSSAVWDSIRYKGDLVNWVDIVWFPQCIPRHSFHLWLIMRNKLKTQDRMKWWDAGSETNLRLMCCSLCHKGFDSHAHLFFECDYSTQVWASLKPLAGLQQVSNKFASISSSLIVHQQQKSAQCIMAKLVLAACSYFVWQERNARLFSNRKRNCEELSQVIMHTVRLKLLSMRFKKTANVQRLLDGWNIHDGFVFDNG